MKCPICNEKTIIEGDMAEDGTETCPEGHYSYTHSYGGFTEHFDDGSGHEYLSFCWWYKESDEKRLLRQEITKKFVEYLKSRIEEQG